MQQSNYGRHSADSTNDKTLSIEPQLVDAGVENSTVPKVENTTGPKNTDMLQSDPDGGIKII